MPNDPVYFWKVDTGVYDTDLKSYSTGPNYVNFFCYSGHGYGWASGQQGGASLHLYSQNPSLRYHGPSREYYDGCNTTWDELRLGHHYAVEELRWFSTYTCNFLTNGGQQYNKDRAGKMFEGLHQCSGFAGVMYLEQNVGDNYGELLNANWSTIDSWHVISVMGQYGHDSVISRVFGHWHTEDDEFDSFNTENLTWYWNLPDTETRNAVYLYYDVPVGE